MRSITPRATGGRSIPHGIFKASSVSSRPMPIASTMSCMTPRAAQGPVTPALCWACARRQFFELADVAANPRRDKNAAAISPIALIVDEKSDIRIVAMNDLNKSDGSTPLLSEDPEGGQPRAIANIPRAPDPEPDQPVDDAGGCTWSGKTE